MMRKLIKKIRAVAKPKPVLVTPVAPWYSKLNLMGFTVILMGLYDWASREPTITEFLSHYPWLVALFGGVMVVVRTFYSNRPIKLGGS